MGIGGVCVSLENPWSVNILLHSEVLIMIYRDIGHV